MIWRWLAALAILAAGFAWGFVTFWLETPPFGLLQRGYGLALRAFGPAPEEPELVGWWEPAGDDPGRDLSEAEKQRLEALGYAEGYFPAPDAAGVAVHDPARAWPGHNLYVSGHGPEAILMDMDGRVLHRWRRAFHEIWPEAETKSGRTDYWRRAHVFEDGDLLAIFDSLGLVRVDRDSRIRWGYLGDCHHDLDVLPDGRIYVLTRHKRRIPELRETGPILDDAITVLSPEGEELAQVSILDAFRNSPYASFLEKLEVEPYGDVFHANTVQVLDGRHADRLPAFAAGNVLISMRSMDVIAVVDMETVSVVWALSGQWHMQHDPILLENGNVLLFDNQGHGGRSKVIELDPATQEIVWAYEGTPENGFTSLKVGTNQRLPNGNTLITESLSGRAFEVTRDGRIVWEFRNPNRAGEHDELVAVLFDVVRLPADFPLGWTTQR